MKLITGIYKKLGPGLVTGAADNDPSGIATYSQAGAQFGYRMLWPAVFLLPFQTAIQEVCARISAVSRKGLAALIKQYYGKKLLYLIVLILSAANIINIGADIGAMAATIQVLFPASFVLLTLLLTFLILVLQVFVPYARYIAILKWLCLSLLVYPLSLLVIHASWTTTLASTFIPKIEFNFKYFYMLTGIIGTTISPYLFFWQSSLEIEDIKEKERHHNNLYAKTNTHAIKTLQQENFLGMFFSQAVAWSIILVAAAVLHPAGITDIQTATEAAKALEPLVGKFAEVVFCIGIVGLGLIAVPALAGSTAYAIADTFEFKSSLDYPYFKAKAFYTVIIFATIIGCVLNFIGFNPMQALIYAAIFNGVSSIPLILIIIMIGNKKKLMGKFKSKFSSNLLTVITLLLISTTTLGMFIGYFNQ